MAAVPITEATQVAVANNGTVGWAGILAISAGATLTDAFVNSEGNLILTRADGTVFNAGYVIGPSGPGGSPPPTPDFRFSRNAVLL